MHIKNLTKKQKIAAALAVILIAVGVWYVLDNWNGPVPDTANYKSGLLSFDYARTAELREYAVGAVSIGEEGESDTFMPIVEVVRYKSDPDTALPANYDAFITRQARNLCAADGPTESLSCTNVESETFTTTGGVFGKKLSLTLIRKNLQTGTTTESTYAPIYAFNVTEPVTAESPLRYASVFVYPALSTLLAGSSSPALMDQVLNTLVISNGITTVGQ